MSRLRLVFPIYGLSRGGSEARALERSLASTPGVALVYVNPLTEMAYVQYDPTLTGPTQLTAAVERVGFRAGELAAH